MISVVFVALAGVALGETVCNGVGAFDTGFGILPPGACFGGSFNGTEMGAQFECTDPPTASLYDNAQCSGTPINSTTLPADSDSLECDGVDCAVTYLTVYTNDECTATGDFFTIPVAFGGCEEETGYSQTYECADDQVTVTTYTGSTDCTGSSSTVSFGSGCQGGVYIGVKCGAPAQLSAVMAVLIAAFTYFL